VDAVLDGAPLASSGESALATDWVTEQDAVIIMPLDPCNDCPACHEDHGQICQKLKFMGIDMPGAMQTYWTVPAPEVIRRSNSVSSRETDLAATGDFANRFFLAWRIG
jgi:D-arabinose 1-dehydrogenase-like Zn-dependent alcohol dehydrogenase